MIQESEKPEAEGDESSADAARVAADVVRTRDEAVSAKARIDECVESTETAHRSAAEAGSAIKAIHESAAETATEIEAVETDVESRHLSIKTAATEIETLLKSAKENQVATSDLAARSAKLDETIADQSENLKGLATEFKKLNSKIESLLPGATSTGLAKSFMERKRAFWWPKVLWGALAVGSILMLCVVGLVGESGFLALATKDVGWDEVLRGLLGRLPIAAPIVWLALFAGRQFLLASRLEEDYAYKEVVSRSFEGYKREMHGIAGETEDATPLELLCTNVLSAMATPPGRLFDKKHQIVTPATAMLEILDNKTVAAFAKQYGVQDDQIRELASRILAIAIGRK